MSAGLLVAGGQEKFTEPDPILVEIFNYANTHNVKALEDLREKIKSKKDRVLNAAYSLSLYIASPERYKQQYVDDFPVDFNDLNDFFEQVEMKGLTPTFLYSIDAIGSIAEQGNEKAIEKVIIGVSLSDAGATELFCDAFMRLFDKQLQKTIRVLFRIDEGIRKRAYSCFEMMEGKEFKSLKEKVNRMKKGATDSEIKVIDEIDRYRQ